MFTTAKQAAKTTVHQATAFGLAAVVTFSILASVNGLATSPAPNGLIAAGSTQVASNKSPAKS